MHIPRIQSNLTPLILNLSPSPTPESPILEESLVETLHGQALRFSLHLTLIGLFETIFFWHFVSVSEDEALIKLVDNYAQGVLNSCAALTDQQRVVARNIFGIFINQTQADAAGFAALTKRSAFNATLLGKSWLYFGGILTLFASLAAIGHCRRYRIKWRPLLAENIALVSLLGLYEWMFFSTIILKYQAISMPELDRRIVDEFMAQC